MGGRSSNFRVGKDNEIYTQKSKFHPLLPYDEDVRTEKDDILINYIDRNNHNLICISTNGFNKETLDPTIKKIGQINLRFKEISKYISKNEPLKIRGATFDDVNTAGCFSSYPESNKEMSIFLNVDNYEKNRQHVEKLEEYSINAKYSSPCDKEEYINHTLSHEYGHFVEKLIIDKKMKADPKTKAMDYKQKSNYRNMLAAQIKNEIIKIQIKEFNNSNRFISEYGNYNSHEFFAETFANLVDCKNPTTLAKSLEIYLKENL